jgi:drug/metabolite transporter (DMT)-like permease
MDRATGNDNLRAILLMLAAMVLFAVEVLLLRWAAVGLALGQIILISGLLGVPVVVLMARASGRGIPDKDARHWPWCRSARWRRRWTAIGVGFLGVLLVARPGEVSVVAPFRYSRLVFSMGLGVVFLAERPEAPTLLGATLIVGPGLYAFARERARKRASLTG